MPTTPVVARVTRWCPAATRNALHARIPAAQLDELVWQDLCQVLSHPDLITAALERAQGGAWLPQELQARRENLRKAIASSTDYG